MTLKSSSSTLTYDLENVMSAVSWSKQMLDNDNFSVSADSEGYNADSVKHAAFGIVPLGDGLCIYVSPFRN